MAFVTQQVRVDFTHDPTSASFTWVDLTNRARSASYRRGRSYERVAVEAGTGTLNLRNDDGALDPTNGASAFAPNVLPFKRIQHNVTLSGVTTPIYTGLVERWPQEWDTGYGYSPVQVVDILAWLSASSLRTVTQQHLVTDAPLLYLPLTDDAGTTSPAMVIAPTGATAAIVPTPGGTGTGTYAFAGGKGPAAEGTSALLLSPVSNAGYALMVSGFSLTFTHARQYIRFNYTGNVSASSSGLINLTGDAGANINAQCLPTGVGTPGAVQVVVTLAAGGSVVFTGATSIADGLPHDVVIEMIQSTNVVNLYVDGVLDGTGTGASALVTGPFVRMAVGAFTVGGGNIGAPTAGTYSHVAVYDVASALSAANQYLAGATGFAGETADARIARVLGYVGWTATTALDACTTTMLAADLAGKSALAVIQDVQVSEGGVFFASKGGVLTYQSRRTRMQATTSSATFGENTAGGEVPWLDIAFDFDPTYVYNDVQIDRTGGGHAIAASDATSQGHYGKRTYSATFGTRSDTEAQDAANWILAASLAPHLRVRSVTVNAAATAGAWAALLPLEIGSRVTVKKRPANGTTITATAFVESIAWDIVDSSRATCTLELSPIPLQALILNDAVAGVLNTDSLGY